MELVINVFGTWPETSIRIENSNPTNLQLVSNHQSIETNPEELFASAFLGSYIVQAVKILKELGYAVKNLNVDTKIYFDNGCISQIDLNLEGKIAGISETEFKRIAEKAKFVCPISELFDSKINLTATIL